MKRSKIQDISQQRRIIHCFPKPSPNSSDTRDVARFILRSICEHGLLVSNEELNLQRYGFNANFEQRRASFTLSSLAEICTPKNGLSSHVDNFGRYGIGMNVSSARKLGLLPAFFLPIF